MMCFFNLAGAVHDPDVEGMEMASIADARLEAVRYIAEVIRDRPNIVWLGEEIRVEVTDKRRLVLFTVIVLGVDSPRGAKVRGPSRAWPAVYASAILSLTSRPLSRAGAAVEHGRKKDGEGRTVGDLAGPAFGIGQICESQWPHVMATNHGPIKQPYR